MAEDNKDNPPSQTPDSEKKPAVVVAPPPRPVTVVPASPPAPAPTPVAPPAAKPVPPKDSGRRGFIKAIFAIGAILSIVPFVPWGSFLSSSIKTGSGIRFLAQKAVVDDIFSKYPVAHGKVVNVKDLATFPPNNHWVITYPTSGDPTVDAQNPDTFVKFELIRLPSELGGNSGKATDFVAFSKVCVHLWCSPNYNPTQSANSKENGYQAGAAAHQQYECPCHGSIYRIPDGKAIQGPASLQAAPTNAIPMLTLQADSAGNLYVFAPNRNWQSGANLGAPVGDIGADGSIGYGRDFTSYNNFIKLAAQQPLDPKAPTEVLG
jgi:Rieske Fe-S protein